MLISKETLIELTCDDDVDGYKVIQRETVGESRWYNRERSVIEFEGRFYATIYNSAKAETIECDPYEYDDDMVECIEVFPREKTIIEYVPAEQQPARA